MEKKEKESKKILKKMDLEKNKIEKKKKKEEEAKTPKEKIVNCFRKVKEYCIKDTSRTILLMAILIALYIVINLCVRNVNLAQIDLTQGKLHTLTDQSKNIAKTVDTDIKFYLWGFSENDAAADLLRQYNAENSKITYQLVTSADLELIQQYNFEEGYSSIIGVSEEGKTSYIDGYDLYTYDAEYNTIDITEQKLTNAINNLMAKDDTKVYFIGGSRTNYTTENGLYYLAQYLQDEYYVVDSIDLIADPTIPDDCDILVIMGLTSDLTELEATNICQYIEKGGDMIITNDIDMVNKNRSLPNFQKVLDEYAISMPNKMITEVSENAVAGSNGILVQSNISSDHEITRFMYNNNVKPLLYGTGLIELDSSKMIEKNVTATPILKTSTSAVINDFSTSTYVENEDKISYVTGAAIQKTTDSGDESRLVVFASTSSFSDNYITINNQQFAMIQYNANIIMNSFAFSANKGELYSIRKTLMDTTYQPTERQDAIVRVIIYAIPVAIILLGVCVWITRRRLK